MQHRIEIKGRWIVDGEPKAGQEPAKPLVESRPGHGCAVDELQTHSGADQGGGLSGLFVMPPPSAERRPTCGLGEPTSQAWHDGRLSAAQ